LQGILLVLWVYIHARLGAAFRGASSSLDLFCHAFDSVPGWSGALCTGLGSNWKLIPQQLVFWQVWQ